jgi:DNA polymerase III delta prime subunit
MNIKEAKEQIKNAMIAYFSKDELGNYKIPLQKQRPVFLIGPPGVGKTAIMEQIAAEMGVGLVSYSMTHHTRQSALGLPYIVKKTYGGREYEVTEYTMSEIIGSVYDLMEATDIKEGILFLDEINCVSETLAPCMLQFLQYKIFGQHSVPDGWIIVTAGNPPEYNKSVRNFDIVTWDRLKRIDVDPDYEVWRDYARLAGVHPAIMTYLSSRKKDFYHVETTAGGKTFVTARGWDDLSQMIFLYEEHELRIDEKLIGQYLQEPRIAKDFAIYYDLFNKYRSDYKIDTILAGTPAEAIIFRAKMAPFDERLSLMAIVFDAISAELREVVETEDILLELVKALKGVGAAVKCGEAAIAALEGILAEQRGELFKGRRSYSQSLARQRQLQQLMTIIEALHRKVHTADMGTQNDEAMVIIKADLDGRVDAWKKKGAATKARLDHVFTFAEQAFGEDREMLLLVTELTANTWDARFIARFGSDKYYEYNKKLDFRERRKDILQRIDSLDLSQ